MIIPINGHILIKPLEHKTFLPSEKCQFDEIGIVLRIAQDVVGFIGIGDKAYFDGWLSSKLPTGGEDEVFWLVPFKDVKAVEPYGTDEVSK